MAENVVISVEKKRTNLIFKGIREVVSILFWLLAFFKLFVYDIDVYLINTLFPQSLWFLEYRFFIFFGTIALLWIVIGNKLFRESVLYVLFYPIILILWKLPKLLFKKWSIAFILVPTLFSIIKSFKKIFILNIAFLIAALFVIINVNSVATILAMIALIVYIAIHYIRQFSRAFTSSSFFTDVGNLIRRIWSNTKDAFLMKEIEAARKYSSDSQEFKTKRGSNLLILYFLNSLFFFSATRLKKIQESRILDIYLIGTLLYTFFLTIIVYALEYLALYHLNPSSFQGDVNNSFFYFLYISFNTLLTVSFGSFAPITTSARFLVGLELFSGVLILIILFFIITTIMRERYREDASLLVGQLNEEGLKIENLIQEEYKFSMEEAASEIKQTSPGMEKLLDYFKGG